MKKNIVFISVSLAAVLLMAGCGKDKAAAPKASAKPTATPAATPAATATATPVPSAAASAPAAAAPAQSGKTAAPKASAPVPTKDTRDSESAQRAEIAKLIKDAEELIEEGLTDDANMTLRDLRSKDLTEEEKKQVDELQGKLVKISD